MTLHMLPSVVMAFLTDSVASNDLPICRAIVIFSSIVLISPFGSLWSYSVLVIVLTLEV